MKSVLKCCPCPVRQGGTTSDVMASGMRTSVKHLKVFFRYINSVHWLPNKYPTHETIFRIIFDVVDESLRFCWNNAFQEIALTHLGNVSILQTFSSYPFNEDCCYLIQISLTFVSKGVVDKKLASIYIMFSHLASIQPLSELLMP